MAQRRLLKELRDLKTTDKSSEYSAEPKAENMFEWTAFIKGPASTPYEGGNFRLQINFPADYPFHAPNIKFLTKVYHPNVSDEGSICLDILKHAWSPALTVAKTLLSITSLLSEPNPNDALRYEVGREYVNNITVFNKNAREYTQKYAQ